MMTSPASETENLFEAFSSPKRSSALATLSGEVTVPQDLVKNGVGDSAGKGRCKPYLTSSRSIGEKRRQQQGKRRRERR